MEYDDALIRLHRAYDEERAHERDADERSWRARVADEAKARDADERSWRARVADEAKARDAAASARELAAAGLNERGMKLQEAIRDDAVKRDLVATKSQKTMTRATVAYVVLTAAILLTAGVQAWAALKQAGAPPPVLTATSVAPPATSK